VQEGDVVGSEDAARSADAGRVEPSTTLADDAAAATVDQAHMAAVAEKLMSAVVDRTPLADLARTVARDARDLSGCHVARVQLEPVGTDSGVDVEVTGVALDVPSVTPTASVPEPGQMLPFRLDADGGLLSLTWPDGEGPSDTMVALLRQLAVLAGFALGVCRFQTERDLISAMAERFRMASELHDTALQDLYAASLRLAGVEAHTEPLVRLRITETLKAIDAASRALRSAVEGLHRVDDDSVVDQLTALVRSSAATLGFEPRFDAEFADEEPLGADLVGDVLAVVKEALSNVARHAGATQASVQLLVELERVTVEVVDDGIGVGVRQSRGLGRISMSHRADTRGGWSHLHPRSDGGSHLVWSVPRP
jgi:signal transduction histidine kinase